MYICIPLSHKNFTKTVGCGKSHKNTNMHNFYSVKYYRHFTKRYFRSFSQIKLHLQSKMIVYLRLFLRLL